jgi:hypothetical protein
LARKWDKAGLHSARADVMVPASARRGAKVAAWALVDAKRAPADAKHSSAALAVKLVSVDAKASALVDAKRCSAERDAKPCLAALVAKVAAWVRADAERSVVPVAKVAVQVDGRRCSAERDAKRCSAAQDAKPCSVVPAAKVAVRAAADVPRSAEPVVKVAAMAAADVKLLVAEESVAAVELRGARIEPSVT